MEAELGSYGAKGVDAEGNMVFKGNAEFFGALVHVVAIDAASESFVFEFFLHTGSFHFVDAFAGLDESAGGQKSG